MQLITAQLRNKISRKTNHGAYYISRNLNIRVILTKLYNSNIDIDIMYHA